jgi:hypothetical protein
MKRRGRKRLVLFHLLLIWSGLLIADKPRASAAHLRVKPDAIHIGAFFSGESVHVSGEIPMGSQAIVEVIGRRIEEQLLRKGRRWDIWMSVGEIDIEDAPYVYLALSTDAAEFSRLGADAKFGYAALKRRIYFKGDVRGITRAETLRRFFELKEEENLYSLKPGALKMSTSAENLLTVEGSFRLPSRIPPGDYVIRLSVVNQDRLLHSEETVLNVRMNGLPAFLTFLSRKHGALFGLFAVSIAVIFGFLVGMAFRRSRAH